MTALGDLGHAPAAAPAAGTRTSAAMTGDEKWLLRIMTGLLLVTVLGQRFVIPVGATPVSVVLVAFYVALGLQAWRGVVRHELVRTELYVVAVALCGAAAYLATWPGEPLSVTSLLLLVVLWAPWAATVRTDLRRVGRVVAGRFVTLMVVAALVGAAQMAAQLTRTWFYTDTVADVVPPQWLLLVYNTSIPVEYGSAIHKANAFVFLEPSFLSQYCALAIVVGLVLRRPAWQLALLLLGIVVALSGSGFLVLAAGGVAVLVRARSTVRPVYVVTGVVALVAALASPAAPLLLDRSDELSQTNSSGYLRFVAPYTEVERGLEEDPGRFVIGAGPGTSERLLESDRGRAGEAVVYSIPAKAVFEYGLVAGSVFVIFVLVSVFRRSHLPAVPTAVTVVLFLVSGSLLLPQTVALGWLLTSAWAGRAGRQDAGVPALRSALRRSVTARPRGTAPTPSG